MDLAEWMLKRALMSTWLLLDIPGNLNDLYFGPTSQDMVFFLSTLKTKVKWVPGIYIYIMSIVIYIYMLSPPPRPPQSNQIVSFKPLVFLMVALVCIGFVDGCIGFVDGCIAFVKGCKHIGDGVLSLV